MHWRFCEHECRLLCPPPEPKKGIGIRAPNKLERRFFQHLSAQGLAHGHLQVQQGGFLTDTCRQVEIQKALTDLSRRPSTLRRNGGALNFGPNIPRRYLGGHLEASRARGGGPARDQHTAPTAAATFF